jgi:magnesium chelatase family protein
LRPVSGLFLAALHASRAGHALIVPSSNAQEVALSGHNCAYGASSLREATQRLQSPGQMLKAAKAAPGQEQHGALAQPCMSDVIGQWQAKRALLVAAAGGHSVLMVGPPGSGKSMLATRLPALLPPLSQPDAMEVAAIASVAGVPLDAARWTVRPFRAPHHTSSASALIGGGSSIRPGEISLAHHGVLFLDELPEFDRRVLESLREPLESGTVTVARASARLKLPAQFQLIAAMNPCPCGYHGDTRQACRCAPALMQRYRQRISGPLLDRIDIRITVPRVPDQEWVQAASGASASTPAIDPAAEVQVARSRREACSGAISARLSPSQLQRCCALPPSSQRLLRRSCEQLKLTGRGIHRLLAVSRTIADLSASEAIEPAHLAEAIQLRRYCASDTM